MFCNAYCKRKMTVEELRELLVLMENQETTDKYVSTSIHIDGYYATIDVEIDNDGNVELI